MNYLKKLLTILRNELGERYGILGNYNYYSNAMIVNTNYAIALHWDNDKIIKKFALAEHGGGIECIIEQTPTTQIEKKLHNNFVVNEDYQIVLDQHNNERLIDLQTAIRIISAIPCLNIYRQPIIDARQHVNEKNQPQNTILGQIPARAITWVQTNAMIK